MKSYVPLCKARWQFKCLAGLVVTFACSGLMAQSSSNPIRIESITGPFKQFAAENVWMQRQALVVNDTDAIQNLRTSYIGKHGGTDFRYGRDFQIPPHTLRRVTFAIMLQDLQKTGRPIGDREMPQVQETYVLRNLATRQELPSSPELQGSIVPGKTAVCRIGAASEDTTNVAFRSLLQQTFQDYETVYTSQFMLLPDRWYGYSIAPVVLLGEEAVDQLRASQMQALLDHIRRGAIMVIVGNPRLGQMLQGELGAAAGVSVAGFHKVMSLDLPTEKGVQPVKYDDPMTMVELCPDQAEVVVSAGGLPLLTRRALGNGWVYVLATPLGAVNEHVLKDIRTIRSLQPSINSNDFPEPAKAALTRIEGRPGPQRLVPTAVLLGLGALTLVGGTIARLKRRGEYIWACLVPLALVVGGGIYYFGQMRSVPQRLSYIGMVSGLDEDTARVQQVFAYGSPSEQTVSFSAGSDSGIIRDFGRSGTLGAQQETFTEAEMFLPDQKVKPDSTRAFLVDDVKRVGRLDTRLTFGPKGLTGTIANHLPADLADGVIFINGRSYSVSPLPAGKDTPVSVGPDNLLGRGEFTTSALQDELKNGLLQKLVVKSVGRQISEQGLLLATMRCSLIEPLPKSPLEQHGWSVATWPVTIAPPASGSAVLVPPGFTQTQVRLGQVWAPMHNPVIDTRTSDLGLRAVLPSQVRGLDQPKAVLTIRLRAVNYNVSLLGVRPDKAGTEVLDRKESPAGTIRIEVPNADRFRNADGQYEFVLRVEMVRGQNSEDTTTQWTLESADIALEGIAR
jgi:hypothetical protein